MTTISEYERMWSAFPQLKRIVRDKSLPNALNQRGDFISPYRTLIDELHDLAQFAVVVGAAHGQIQSGLAEAPTTKEPRERLIHLRDLERELDKLRSKLNIFEGFCRDRRAEIGKILEEVRCQMNDIDRQEHERRCQDSGGEGTGQE